MTWLEILLPPNTFVRLDGGELEIGVLVDPDAPEPRPSFLTLEEWRDLVVDPDPSPTVG